LVKHKLYKLFPLTIIVPPNQIVIRVKFTADSSTVQYCGHPAKPNCSGVSIISHLKNFSLGRRSSQHRRVWRVPAQRRRGGRPLSHVRAVRRIRRGKSWTEKSLQLFYYYFYYYYYYI
jgi:hypothetical protein